ncbi:hypothetical protein AEAC466_13640 [Asticcacaulis sp. AC466]|uniref:TonB-dependent receptor n=1 Tax=Asticcacaulis sp. AC466 TaxID=1282362 RepID=UPI0003C40244|nr:TonB-dependent receptor [Asticcacaulis sp. AC466]ESQ83289.1 hypothetical protein AEAC466_13640 [Asticcacaulis sp. AC466]
MTIKNSLMTSGACLAALLLTTGPAFAQETAAPTDQGAGAEDTVVVVTGLRKSFQSATDIKRKSAQIVDSIVAEDIGKLPDTNIAETLQRIPGVQIARNTRGEGNAYVVHGLKQVMTTLNGRLLFTNANRSATLLDFSADILSGVDVYKTATADQIEGGLGGLINIHAARPFDFKGLRASATVAANYSAIHDEVTPRLSGIVSNRWQTAHGEFGALLGFQYEQIDSGGYQTGTNAYVNRNDLYDLNGDGHVNSANGADIIQIPTNAKAQYERGERRRGALYSSMQWRPNDDLTLYTDLLWTYSGGHSSTKVLTVKYAAADGAVAGPITLKPGTNIVDTATFTNPIVQVQQGFSDNPYNNYNAAFGGKYHHDHLTVGAELSFQRSAGPFYSRSIVLQGRAPKATIGLSGDQPDINLTGFDATSTANFAYASYSDLGQRTNGKETVAKIDVRYDFDTGPLTAVLGGLYYSDHDANNNVYSVSFSPANSGLRVPLSAVTELTPDDLFDGKNSSLNQWVTVKRDILAKMRDTRILVGVSPNDQAYPLNNAYNYNEKITGAYLEAMFAFDTLPVPIDGNIGVRQVHTDGVNHVYQVAMATTPNAVKGSDGKYYTAVTGGKPYDNLLPSLNVRARFTDDLFLRLAYSKAISRPEFGNLSPALVLNNTGTGSGGNPALEPVKADQYDASLEYYFGGSNMLALSLFQKNVTGFIQKFAVTEEINGTSYQISRPRNAGTGDIKGYEVSYQQFFDFLPGYWSGLGVQANYTYVDSALSVLGQSYTAAAEQLSKNSYNLTGIYEKGPVSMHLSYNWRDKYIQTTSGDSFNRPLMVAPLESLDFSATYKLNERMSIKFDAVNLTKAYQHQYYGPSPLATVTNASGDYSAPLLPTLANQLDHSFEIGFHYAY